MLAHAAELYDVLTTAVDFLTETAFQVGQSHSSRLLLFANLEDAYCGVWFSLLKGRVNQHTSDNRFLSHCQHCNATHHDGENNFFHNS